MVCALYWSVSPCDVFLCILCESAGGYIGKCLLNMQMRSKMHKPGLEIDCFVWCLCSI